ncbi:MAG: glycosyltransferase family 61 protein [Chloroflexota bacterium]
MTPQAPPLTPAGAAPAPPDPAPDPEAAATPDVTTPILRWDDPALPEPLRLAGVALDAGRDGEALDLVTRSGSLDTPEALAIQAVALLLLDATVSPDADIRPHLPPVIDLAAALPAALATLSRRLADDDRWSSALAVAERLEPSSPGAVAALIARIPPERRDRGAPYVLAAMRTDPLPDLWEAWPWKRALVEARGADDAAPVLAHLLSPEVPRTGTWLPLAWLDEVATEPGRTRIDLAPLGEVRLRQPRMFGFDRDPEVHPVQPRPWRMTELHDAAVLSKSSFPLEPGRAIHDVTADEWGRLPQDPGFDPAIVAARDRRVLALVPRREHATVRLPAAFSLVGAHSHAFGHWVFEHLFRLWPWLDRPESAGVPILVDRQMPPQHRESLALFAGPDHPVVELAPGQVAWVDRLWAGTMPVFIASSPRPGGSPSSLAPDGSVPRTQVPRGLAVDPPSFVRHLASARAAAATIPPLPGMERVYLTRADTQHRRVINRPAVEALLAARGYRSLDFGRLSFTEQVAVMRGARSIVAPSGSALLLALFAPEGSSLGILMHDSEGLATYDWQCAVAALLDQEVMALVAPRADSDRAFVKHSNYRVDLDALSAFVDALEERIAWA